MDVCFVVKESSNKRYFFLLYAMILEEAEEEKKEDMYKSMLENTFGIPVGQELDYLFRNNEEQSSSSLTSPSPHSPSQQQQQQHQQEGWSFSVNLSSIAWDEDRVNEENENDDEKVMQKWETEPPKLRPQPDSTAMEESNEEGVAPSMSPSLSPTSTGTESMTRANASLLEEWRVRFRQATEQQHNLQQQAERLKQRQAHTSPAKTYNASTGISKKAVKKKRVTFLSNGETKAAVPTLLREKENTGTPPLLRNDSSKRVLTPYRVSIAETPTKSELQQPPTYPKVAPTPPSRLLPDTLPSPTPTTPVAGSTFASPLIANDSSLSIQDLLSIEKDRRIQLELKCRGLQQQLNIYQTTTSPRLETLKQLKCRHAQDREQQEREYASLESKYQTLQSELETQRAQHAAELQELSLAQLEMKRLNANHRELQQLKQEEQQLKQEEISKWKMRVAQFTKKYESLRVRNEKDRSQYQQKLQQASIKYQSLESQYLQETKEWQELFESTKHELELADTRYDELQEKYHNDTKEWHSLLGAEISKSGEIGATTTTSNNDNHTQSIISDGEDEVSNGEDDNDGKEIKKVSRVDSNEDLKRLLDQERAKSFRLSKQLLQREEDFLRKPRLEVETEQTLQIPMETFQELQRYKSELEQAKKIIQGLQNELQVQVIRPGKVSVPTSNTERESSPQSYSMKSLPEFDGDGIFELAKVLESKEEDGKTPERDAVSFQCSLEKVHAKEIQDLERNLRQQQRPETSIDESSSLVLGRDLPPSTSQLDASLFQVTQSTNNQPLDTRVLLSPILPNRSGLHVFGLSDESLEYSLPPRPEDVDEKEDKKVSSSMERIDQLLEELGQMDQETAKMLGREDTADEDMTPDDIISDDTRLVRSSTESVEEDLQERDIDTTSLKDSADGLPKTMTGTTKDDHDDSTVESQGENTISNSSSMLDKTLGLLSNLKGLMTTQGNQNEVETSILKQLEVLSEMMEARDNDELPRLMSELSSSSSKMMQQEDHAELSQLLSTTQLEHQVISSQNHDDSRVAKIKNQEINTSAAIRSVQSSNGTIDDEGLQKSALDPWRVLVQELQDRIAFLEQDREDLERVTQNLLDQERESSQIKLDAAIATAKRESMEQFQEFQQCTQKQLKNLYSTLCVNCQRRINTAL